MAISIIYSDHNVVRVSTVHVVDCIMKAVPPKQVSRHAQISVSRSLNALIDTVDHHGSSSFAMRKSTFTLYTLCLRIRECT